MAGCVHPPGGAAVMGFCASTAVMPPLHPSKWRADPLYTPPNGVRTPSIPLQMACGPLEVSTLQRFCPRLSE
eukprot:982746-Prorocentrum_minimum.AAC.1